MIDHFRERRLDVLFISSIKEEFRAGFVAIAGVDLLGSVKTSLASREGAGVIAL